FCMARALGSPGRITRAAAVPLGLRTGQGAPGVVQYQLALPEPLASLPMVGAVLMIAAAADVVLAGRWQPRAAGAGEQPRVTHHSAEAPSSDDVSGTPPTNLVM